MALEELLTAAARQEFVSRIFRRAPFAQPRAASGLVRFLDWSTLDRVLQSASSSEAGGDDVLVVRHGRLVPTPVPRSLSAARPLLDAGSSLVVRNAEARDAGMRELRDRFAAALAARARIQLFVTPKGERGFGWHYDAEEVFIVQTMGTKEYFFRENTVNPRPRPQPSYDFAAVREERTPIMACTLIAGDWLYVPRGWWHVATAHEDSLAISIGVLEDS